MGKKILILRHLIETVENDKSVHLQQYIYLYQQKQT